VNIDPASGLPELPKGHYWHVREAYTAGWHRVEIRKGWVYPFSSVIEYKLLSASLTEDTLLDMSIQVYREFQSARVAVADPGKALRGSYPPKTIKKKDTV
jgi:hypothetical protein